MPTIFHQGDLQSGIASAIQQQKLVACFIYSPDDETSQKWENEYLTANTCSGNVCGQIGSLIAHKAVLLKIEHGSQEAGFLGAFVSVESAPALVVIRNGKVLETIEGGVGKEEFVERLGKAVGLDEQADDAGADESGKTQGEDGAETEPSTAVEREVLESDPLIESEPQTSLETNSTATETELQPGNRPTSFPTHQPSEAPSQANTLLAERGRRLEAERIRREADEKAVRLARQKARQEEASAAARQTTTTESNEKQRARDAWIYQQKQRKDEAKKEKVRILQQIESDKQERKAAALRRKEGAATGGAGEFSDLLAQSGERAVAQGIKHGSCALQIRLFDGSSIKGKFAADADLATAVRTWVREASPDGGADIPYSFRQILAPKPSRSIEVGEEGESLQDLGLVPSATLVLVPVSGAVEAYSASTTYIGSAVNGANWVASTAYAFGSSLLGAIPFFGGSASTTAGAASEGPYMAGTGDPQDLSNARGADMAGADGGQTGTKVRVKTLADQRAEQAKKGKEGTEFYNGNSSAFQGDGDK